jgi:cysteine desulfurase
VDDEADDQNGSRPGPIVGTYLDHAASTPVRPEAVAAMVPFLTECFGNPSGGHGAARVAKQALEEARETVAAALGADPGEVIFTAGGTEADNLAVEGAARAARSAGAGNGVVTTAFENKGVLAACDRLATEGFRVCRVGVDRAGIVDLDALADALDAQTAVVSVMLVNNEVGTIQPLSDVARLVAERAPRAALHTDAVQAVPWLDVAAAASDAPFVAISAHKFGGPKGTGALVARRGAALVPLIEGGGQERGMRAGTVNVAGVVAMATALRLTVEQRTDDVARIRVLRDRLAAGLAAAVPDCFFNGDVDRKVAGNCHVGFHGVEAEVLLVALDRAGVYAAAGSSCSSGATEPSHVLEAMGVPRIDALASIRLSLGYASTDADVDRALEVIPRTVATLRRASGARELAGATSDEGLRRSARMGTEPAESTMTVVPGAERVRP